MALARAKGQDSLASSLKVRSHLPQRQLVATCAPPLPGWELRAAMTSAQAGHRLEASFPPTWSMIARLAADSQRLRRDEACSADSPLPNRAMMSQKRGKARMPPMAYVMLPSPWLEHRCIWSIHNPCISEPTKNETMLSAKAFAPAHTVVLKERGRRERRAIP